jgi:hypothetical protein
MGQLPSYETAPLLPIRHSISDGGGCTILADLRCCEEAVWDWRRHSVPLFKRHSQQKGHDRFADIFSVGCAVLEYASLVVLGSWDDPSDGGELLCRSQRHSY